jgi:tRNA A-37 threonylcarbamoyl transferase component Bud32
MNKVLYIEYKVIKNKGANAVYCHKRLQKTINTNGTRKEAPSLYELECVKVIQP